MVIEDKDKREYYELEAINNGWTGRELERQINSGLCDRKEKQSDENPTIGILLCADKNNSVVKYSLPEDNKTIMASKYQLYLPTEHDLLEELKK